MVLSILAYNAIAFSGIKVKGDQNNFIATVHERFTILAIDQQNS